MLMLNIFLISVAGSSGPFATGTNASKANAAWTPLDFTPPNGVFFTSVDWAYQSEKNFYLYESKEFKADSFEVGLRAGYTFAEAKYEVALFARNLLDEEILQGAIDFDNLTGMTNEPRLIGIEFSTRF